MSEQLHLPATLRLLVKESVGLLGELIRETSGDKLFKRVEDLRQKMADLRDASNEKKSQVLKVEFAKLASASNTDLHLYCRAFSLMLELMNSCESAYRSFRIAHKEKPLKGGASLDLEWVLTAHPTEARSPQMLGIFSQIQSCLMERLEGRAQAHNDQELSYWLRAAWKLPLARNKKPQPKDEIFHVTDFLLRPEVFHLLLKNISADHKIRLKSWVGADKDGHPGIDQRSLMESLHSSRQQILTLIKRELRPWQESFGSEKKSRFKQAMTEVNRNLETLKKISPRDELRVQRFRQSFSRAQKLFEAQHGVGSPELRRLDKIFGLFPLIVLPLELRESSDVLREIVAAKKRESFGLWRMLRCLASLQGPRKGENFYAASLIVSMTESAADLKIAAQLIREAGLQGRLRVVPLFEKESALRESSQIVEAVVRSGEDFEVMLGYSDSAKEIGVLPSRYLMAKSLSELEKLFNRKKLKPLYFHGSGGSVARGGGSFKEQSAWWPSRAFHPYKATLQGEMIQRTFASPEILQSQLDAVASAQNAQSPRDSSNPLLEKFCGLVQSEYRKLIEGSSFLEVVEKATAYRYLQDLKIGSRPNKRKSLRGLQDLRAIPWVLAWTQTRNLLPTWWGVGSAYEKFSVTEKAELKKIFLENPLFSSFVKQLGFTLAKVELSVWQLYLQNSTLDPQVQKTVFENFCLELKGAEAFLTAMSGEKDFVWFRPWLGESIQLRSPMIHPLNMIQIIASRRAEKDLLRETVTGIACGMLTTG